ncbi:MAG: DUF5319 domain-containing protein [Actinomycetia bacterium]|nr:DUF5319 domain-containing protein [Actinomycetes bacterium]
MTPDLGPLDPFLGDPDDPAAMLDELDPTEPLTDEERAELESDLDEFMGFRRELEPLDIDGICIDCEDCGEPHYFGWDLMEGNLRNLLGQGQVNIHEPAFAPDPAAFVSWDYARGYTDALHAAARRR